MNNPFKNLKSLLRYHELPIRDGEKDHGRPVPPACAPPFTGEKDDKVIFQEAMAGVKPISSRTIIKVNPEAVKNESDIDEDKEGRNCLMRLVRHGEGFDVAGTPEYMEGANYKVHPELIKRLHNGAFSIQAHIDLHGMTVAQAALTFDAFFKRATSTGLRGLLIIHGRGLSSPDKPVLKLKVREWLTYGSWRKWVIAFSSARPCDGGAGATYVLLRKSPATKRDRKKLLKRSNNS